jgi:hypothetical protein
MTLKGDAQGSQLGLAAGVRRRLAAVLLLTLCVPALALAANTDPQKRFTAADNAKAGTLVLRKSDFVAGWKRDAVTAEDETEFSCPNYRPDQSDLVLTGEAKANFSGPDALPSVFSVANVYRTRREATLAWARSAKPALVPCVASMLEKEFEGNGTPATVTRKGSIAFPRYAQRTVAYRFTFDLTYMQNGKKTTVPMTIHMVALGQGRGDVFLMTIAFGSGVPMADLKAFAKVTAQRLAAAKL